MAPACRLPPEVLSKVFLGVLRDATLRKSWRTRCVLRVTHVCAKWRATALGCSEIWSRLRFDTPRLASLWLERAKQSPLTIAYDGNTDDIYCDALELSLSQVGRIRHLKLIEGNKRYLSVPLGRMLLDWAGDVAAPILETLYLQGETPYLGDDKHLPASFLGGGAPRMRHLHLYTLPWANLRDLDAPALTHLTFGYHSMADRFPAPNSKDMYHTLTKFPLLQVLSLKNCLPTPPEAPSTTYQIAPSKRLPSLRQLELLGWMGNIPYFLDEYDLPPRVSMTGCSAVSGSDTIHSMRQTLEDIFDRLRGRIAHGRVNGAEAAARSVEYKLRIADSRVWGPCEEFRLEYTKETRDACDIHAISLSMLYSDLPWTTTLKSIHQHLDVSLLTELEIDCGNGVTEEDWCSTFGRAPLLSNVKLGAMSRHYYPQLFNAFCRPISPNDPTHPSDPAVPYFAALDTLTLRVWLDFVEEGLGEVVKGLNVRQKSSNPIQRVVLSMWRDFMEREDGQASLRILKESCPGLQVEVLVREK